jgi:hypothetical protein
MNCPECKQSVGNDQYSYSDWKMEDRDGELSIVRDLFVECDFCGVFNIKERHSPRQFVSIHHPRNRKDVKRILRKLPHREVA